MTEETTYKGSCHCGKVSYEVRLALTSLVACNCSICSRKGALMAFVPEAAFSLKSGEEALSDYQFNKRKIHHLFCSTCGIHTHGGGSGPDGNGMRMINVRCLEGIDPDAYEVQRFDGKSM